MVHGYDIKTSLDFFRKLLDEREDWLKTRTSARHAINCAITAWQLHDWVFAEKEKYPFMNQFATKNDFKSYLKSKENFQTLHDLADGAKHYVITNRDTTIISTSTSSWAQLSRSKERVKDKTPQLFLTFRFGKGGGIMAFDDLLYLITLYWYEFFRDKLNEDVETMLDHGGYTYF
ncbi:MAG: hypothetical protein J0I32_01335 [Sphingobacteriales bacterium]|nr:hypothetical protein [Sphingobacteriales bacterium]OJW04682.1 MAG: hypothetical protein BGO52_19425 [Sphingobacteriales bacterium 44-61]